MTSLFEDDLFFLLFTKLRLSSCKTLMNNFQHRRDPFITYWCFLMLLWYHFIKFLLIDIVVSHDFPIIHSVLMGIFPRHIFVSCILIAEIMHEHIFPLKDLNIANKTNIHWLSSLYPFPRLKDSHYLFSIYPFLSIFLFLYIFVSVEIIKMGIIKPTSKFCVRVK